jgi:ribosomal protein S27E
MQVVCPGCGEERDLGAEVHASDVVSCASCAGVVFRLEQHNGTYVLHEVPHASCPECGTMLQLPDDVQAGATFLHCDRSFVVTYAYGTYALESPVGD